MKKLLVVIGFLTLNLSAIFSQTSIQKVKVEGGIIEGILEDYIQVYKGVPFAAPPIGELRWKAPQPVKPWDGVLKADKYAPACPQLPSSWPGASNYETNEDCLYLNIWTPAKSSDEKLPVMVLIHGGGFFLGSASDPWFYGDVLAKQGVILVNIAYRIGALGFMAHPELTSESNNKVSGNYGLLDQIAALKWVQNNIAQFGGDPAKVTIIGSSSGAASVSILAASPVAKGLFRGAISQSGGYFNPVAETNGDGGIQKLKNAEKVGVEFMKRMGAKNLAELRKISPDKWAKDPLSGVGVFFPIVDGYVIADDQYKLYEKGKYNDVDILIGTNSDEGCMFVQPMELEDYKKEMQKWFGPYGERALKLYPATSKDETFYALADRFRESVFAWSTYAWANLQSKTGKSDVYVYYFDRQQPAIPSVPIKIRGAHHGVDVHYVFGHLDKQQPIQYAAEDKKLSEQMVKYWTNFAKTGNPNGEDLPYWSVYKEGTSSVMYLNENPKIGYIPNEAQLKLMEDYFRWKRTGKLTFE